MIPKLSALSDITGSLGSAGITLYDFQISYLIFSILISIGLFFIAKIIIQKKLGDLNGSSKLLGLISVAIGASEIIYIGLNFGMFTLALEFIAYLGIGLWIILIPFQTHLKNMASGISNFMNTEINIGDIVEIEGKRGVIVDFHLTKTFLITDNGETVSIPNHRFHEDVMTIYPKNKKPNALSSKLSELQKKNNFKN